MRDGVSRRQFIKASFAASALALAASKTVAAQTEPGPDSIIMARDGAPNELVSAALEPIGGIERFVSPGDTVLVKPNASFAVDPDTGPNTNTAVASTVVSLAIEAGADRVVLADHTISKPGSITTKINGLKSAAESCGGEFLVLQESSDFQPVAVEGATTLTETDVADIYLDSDTLINLPVLKHHDATGCSIGLKNLMGLVYDRSFFHQYGLYTCIAELSLAIKPNVTIVDATRTLMTNGPRGPGETQDLGRVVAGVDPVAVDVACIGLGSSLGYSGFDLDRHNEYISIAQDLGIGDGNPASVAAKTFDWDSSQQDWKCIATEENGGLPEWTPYASLSLASIALGLAATALDRRRVRDVR